MKNNKIFYFIVSLIVAIFFVLLLGLKEEKNYLNYNYSGQSKNYHSYYNSGQRKNYCH